jgi:hypothetical protein
MWGQSYKHCKQTLDKFGFLEPDHSKIMLKPFLITYAEQSIDQDSENRLKSMITEYYAAEMKSVYKLIDSKAATDQ